MSKKESNPVFLARLLSSLHQLRWAGRNTEKQMNKWKEIHSLKEEEEDEETEEEEEDVKKDDEQEDEEAKEKEEEEEGVKEDE